MERINSMWPYILHNFLVCDMRYKANKIVLLQHLFSSETYNSIHTLNFNKEMRNTDSYPTFTTKDELNYV